MLQRLRDAWRGRGDQVAVTREDAAWTFDELIDAAERMVLPAGALGYTLPGGPESVALSLAGLHRAGSRVVAIPSGLTAFERERLAARVPLVEFRDASSLASWPRGDAPTEAGGELIQLTSGSTGDPRAIVFTEREVVASLAGELPTSGAVFCTLPQGQAMGCAVGFEALAGGCAVHFTNRFDPAADLRRMAEAAVAHVYTCASYVRMMARLGAWSAARLPTLQEITLGAEPVSRALLMALREQFPAVAIHVRYGLSEAFGAISRWTLPAGAALPDADEGLVGTSRPGIELQVRGGEVFVSGPTCAKFERTENGVQALRGADGFLATGDVGELATDGALRIGGRIATFLKVHGHRIDPVEVENVLRAVEGVAEVVVVGVPDEMSGEAAIAGYEAAGAPPSLADLQAACRARLAGYKHPTRFERVDRLPRTAAGKLDRRTLAAQLAALAARPKSE